MTLQSLHDWFQSLKWKVFPFQEQSWKKFLNGYSGILNAPTGSGKTYSLLLPAIVKAAQEKKPGTRIIWITPLRALSREIHMAAQRAVDGLGLNWKVASRTGDTSTADRRKMKSHPPEILITTPESLHLLLSQSNPLSMLGGLEALIVDEWHELMGSKRGVQVQLALSWLMPRTGAQVWGISATIGNLSEAGEVLMGNMIAPSKQVLIRADIQKKVQVRTVIPDKIEEFPWAGHLGIKLLDKVLPIIEASQSCLIFTNTRSQCEIWYQRLLDADPDLSGNIAMHHGSISRELRDWVEQALHDGQLKAVVCTSSLDLGVDFRPVETIIQIGSPKGVARFLQRAGRSGHQPGSASNIYFVPTHSLELIEGSALRKAIELDFIEERIPYLLSYDVLLQYMMTLASGPGFKPDVLFDEIRQTFCYRDLTQEDWRWLLSFLVHGGKGLQAYESYKKVDIDKNGYVRVLNAGIAKRHRMSIGTIVGDVSMNIKYLSGKRLGTIEEWFISQLEPGDVFWFAGRNLELKRIKGMDVIVRRSTKKSGRVPSWLGGRMPLSGQLSAMIRNQIDNFTQGDISDPELEALVPLFLVQDERSLVPGQDDFLIEYFEDREGYHLVLYPFEGRYVHEGLGAILAYRISQIRPLSFTIAMNDYGLELLSDQPIPVEEALGKDLFNTRDLSRDIHRSINEVEMARRRFRDIASISGMIFKGYPGKQMKDKHLQTSTGLLFDVFESYDPDNLLYQQTFEEVKTFQLQEVRMREALQRIQKQRIRLQKPGKATPFAFPIIVDRLRERLSSEKLEDRIQRMREYLTKT